MSRKTKRRVSYVLPLAGDTSAGHRLGLQGLAVDHQKSILYSAGRDGVICAWGLLDANARSVSFTPSPALDATPLAQSAYRQHVQAHTNWINDLCLADAGQAVVSASSDVSVKVWRPFAQDPSSPLPIGQHTDYVKRVSTPHGSSDWVASGSLDRKVCLWDLHGAGQRLQIDVADHDSPRTDKCSIYALATTDHLVAAGGPESVIKLWDARSGQRTARLVGHTDYIRDILISRDGDVALSASADRTVKVWSLTMSRCLYTMSMHSESVWSLFTDHPHLKTFYSGDRSGMVVKTDARATNDLDNALSVAICQEQEGINALAASGGHIWTATAHSSINRWADADLSHGVQIPDSMKTFRFSNNSRTRFSNASSIPPPATMNASTDGPTGFKIPINCVLRLSNTASFPPFFRDRQRSSIYKTPGPRKVSIAAVPDSELGTFKPLRDRPEETIEGRNGLVKHMFLNDRRRVLTLDTLGEVVLWDLLRCASIKSFGKCDLEEAFVSINPKESVANWCTVDTRTGTLRCILEENHCFDAEIYADEVEDAKGTSFKDDQRIILGKWILRYLFSNLIDEELRRDEEYRQALVLAGSQQSATFVQRPTRIQIPAANGVWDHGPDSASTLKAANGGALPTPGLAIGAATPGLRPLPSPSTAGTLNLDAAASENDSTRTDATDSRPTSADADYFSTQPPPNKQDQESGPEAPGALGPSTPTSPGNDESKSPQKGMGSLFGKRLKVKASFASKKAAKSPSLEPQKTAVQTDKTVADDGDSKLSQAGDKIFDDTLLGVIARARAEYTEQVARGDETLTPALSPSLPSETPMLRLPKNTLVLIQEDRPDSGGVVDLYEGELDSIRHHVDRIEKVAPAWLGEVLLRNRIPVKDPVKITFVLEPFDASLPRIIQVQGSDRLNANRMLRCKKILSYVAERLEPQAYEADAIGLLPEEYLELYCNGQRVPTNMTLLTMRLHLWRSGGDLILHYKGNGRRQLPLSTATNVSQ